MLSIPHLRGEGIPHKRDKKRYDFWVENKYIIECHGIQHYKQKFKNTLMKEIENDNLKYKLAIDNGILFENYIVIDCRESNFDYLKTQFIKSLSNFFNLDNIIWEKVNEFCLTSIAIQTIELWNNGLKSTTKIVKELKISESAVRTYLKKGVESGLCDYYPKQQLNIVKFISSRCKSVLQYDLENNFIREYVSCTEASKQTGTHRSKISLVASGNRKTAGGFIWKFK